jgi:lipopolysaccharide/colanic/teichoic acid biosynthesis glycosyltransferase
MKRCTDIVFSSVALLVFSPLLIVVAIILRCTGEGSVFYRQERIGLGGRSFLLYKFATMCGDCGKTSSDLLTAEHDPRILPVGRILRTSKINELPQLFNVLLGDMSLIGPRPQVRPHFDMYPEHVKQQIIKVRPGLSGVGSIIFRSESLLLAGCHGDRNQVYAEDIAPYKGELELWYVQHQSAKLDLLLILMTVLVVLCRRSRHCVQWLRDLPQPRSALVAASLFPDEGAGILSRDRSPEKRGEVGTTFLGSDVGAVSKGST